MDNRETEFRGSKDLTHCLGWYGWALYDVTPPPARIEPFSWEEISKRDQAVSCLVSHNYYILPIPEGNETIKSAYAKSRKEHTFPILKIPKEERRLNIVAENGLNHQQFNCYFLTEFHFQKDQLLTFTPPLLQYNYPSRVIVPSSRTAEIFIKYFSVIQFMDKGAKFKEAKKLFVN
ncbi:hypothetical protein HY494_01500 [Candidatus Woesearchaeota archaeon]|nr:hypothetical protein [Candidatus Woesearchaeota archaeon]